MNCATASYIIPYFWISRWSADVLSMEESARKHQEGGIEPPHVSMPRELKSRASTSPTHPGRMLAATNLVTWPTDSISFEWCLSHVDLKWCCPVGSWRGQADTWQVFFPLIHLGQCHHGVATVSPQMHSTTSPTWGRKIGFRDPGRNIRIRGSARQWPKQMVLEMPDVLQTGWGTMGLKKWRFNLPPKRSISPT